MTAHETRAESGVDYREIYSNRRRATSVVPCLGHTHYFSNDAVALAVEIDRLIAG